MNIEKINSYAPENLAENAGIEIGEEFPPFDPENAERLADRYQEQTFVLAAANSLINSPDIMYVDRAMSDTGERAAKDGSTIFEALKTLSGEADTDKEGGFAATDLMNAFIDTTAAYIVSKDEKPARGLAKGLMTTMEMQLAGAPTDKPNRAADELRVDLELTQPIIDEFIEGYNTDQESLNDFKDYLKNALDMEEVELRSAKRRNMQPSPDTEHRIQALKTVLIKLDDLQSGYEGNLRNLKDTAYANHRIIK